MMDISDAQKSQTLDAIISMAQEFESLDLAHTKAAKRLSNLNFIQQNKIPR